MKKWNSIEEENQAYWTKRAASYTEAIRAELSDEHVNMWGSVITGQLLKHFGAPACANGLNILEAGTGPGFLSILLASMGHKVTAVDYTPSMLEEAKINARAAGVNVDFYLMNAEETSFSDGRFDLVISRNLTWNLPHPEKAYREWLRILAPGGMILIFDANYYNHLYDEEARAGYLKDRELTALAGEEDIYLSTDTAAMEAIAKQIPLSQKVRPCWDLDFFSSLGVNASADTEIWKQVWDRNEQINQGSVPMFMISACP